MVQITRLALCLAATCCATVSGSVLASVTDGNTTALRTALNETVNDSASVKYSLLENQCMITFTYWEHDDSAVFDINFVGARGTIHTTEMFHDDPMPIDTSNTEFVEGQLKLMQIYPRHEMACISSISLTCGWYAARYGTYPEISWVMITADAIQESWIRKTGGQRKPVNWSHGPCVYFRNTDWDKGSFRALDVRRDVFECGSDYMCIAGRIETFSH